MTLAPRSAEARAVLALALDWSGQVDRAVQAGLEAVEIDPASPAALGALAEAYADHFRLPEADERLAAAMQRAPNDAELFRVEGSVREARADYSGAVQSYRHAVVLAPNWSYLHTSLGHALRAQESYDEALAAFGRAVELAPEDARAEGGRGMVYYAREEGDAAIASFQRALDIDPTYPTAHAQVGWIYYGRREYARAEPYFSRAIELDRDAGRVAQYRHALGWIMLSARRFGEAREQFTRTLELNPNLQGARDGLRLAQSQRRPRRAASTRSLRSDSIAGSGDAVSTLAGQKLSDDVARRSFVAIGEAIHEGRERVGMLGGDDPQIRRGG